METETYYYGNGLIYEKSNDVGILVYHYNHLGSTTAVTDQAGKLVYSYDYGTYGELTTTTEYSTIAPKVRFLYNGQLGVMTDDNTLYYMRQRYYNPQIKRFINQDILTGSIANSSSLNRYSYVEGNPVSYTDPFGLSPFSYISQPLHNTLDWFGMIPFVGAGFDLINATIYLMEGEPTYALFAAISSVGPADGVKFIIKNGKKSIIGMTLTGLFCQTDAGAGLKQDLTGLGQDYITYQGYDQMSRGELALSLTIDIFFGAKSGYDDLNIKKKKVDVDLDDFVPNNATNKVNKIDGDDELIHVYRGTSITAEQMAYEETGYLMSDATRRAYYETGSLETAQEISEKTHNKWIDIWGNENEYVQAHGAFGTELSEAFGIDRTMISVTTDSEVARYFAGKTGKVYEAYVPRSQLIKQTLDGAGENEYLIRFSVGGFE